MKRLNRQIILSLIVIAAAGCLRSPILMVIQILAGVFLLAVGLRRKRSAAYNCKAGTWEDSREETPEGMCPTCYHVRGEGIQLEYNERTECDECPNCDYYQ